MCTAMAEHRMKVFGYVWLEQIDISRASAKRVRSVALGLHSLKGLSEKGVHSGPSRGMSASGDLRATPPPISVFKEGVSLIFVREIFLKHCILQHVTKFHTV